MGGFAVSTSPAGLFLVAGGLVGFAGVGLSARASHGGDGPQLVIAAQFLMFHAPVFVALAAVAAQRAVPAFLGASVGLLMAGLALFCGDLAMRATRAQSLFPFAAPLGGTLLMAGWLTLIVTGVRLAFLRKGG
jgi:uncharacterized membrane protein YgdD (TMEM256/DUF423 family)